MHEKARLSQQIVGFSQAATKMMADQWIRAEPPVRGSRVAHKGKNHNVVGACGTSLSSLVQMPDYQAMYRERHPS
jgi:hypothetical protein